MNKGHYIKSNEECASSSLMTTPHIGDEDELVTADTRNPAENPDKPELAEIPRVMERSLQQICTVNGNTG